MTETDTYAAYAAGLKKALDVFVGAPNTPDTVQAALFAVRRFHTTFLAEHGSFAALGEPRATNTAGNSLQVCAPICTREEKIKADRFAAQRDQLMEELKAKSSLEDRAAARRYANMLRQHRRLLRKHADRVPPSTRMVWDSLTAAQQYAILKDIDYAIRHDTVGETK